MSQVRQVGLLTINDGQLEAFKEAVGQAVALAKTEDGTLTYDWYLNEDGTRALAYEVYADSNAALAHLAAMQPNIPALSAAATPAGSNLLGDLSPELAGAAGQAGATLWTRFATQDEDEAGEEEPSGGGGGYA